MLIESICSWTKERQRLTIVLIEMRCEDVCSSSSSQKMFDKMREESIRQVTRFSLSRHANISRCQRKETHTHTSRVKREKEKEEIDGLINWRR